MDVRQSKLNHDPCLEPILFKCRDCDKWGLRTVRKERGHGEDPGTAGWESWIQIPGSNQRGVVVWGPPWVLLQHEGGREDGSI